MLHAIRYEGGYERNFPTLRAGTTQYEGDDGAPHPVADWPAGVTGLRYGFMEQPGKRFVVVRVGLGDDEVLLHHPVRLDPARHMGGKRFSADAITLADSSAGELLGDILDANPDQQRELTALREQIRRELRAAKAR